MLLYLSCILVGLYALSLQLCQQAPPKEPPVPTEGVKVVSISNTVTMLRGVCNGRFKFAIEYGNKRGTTENTYVIKVCNSLPQPLRCLLALLAVLKVDQM